MKKRIWAVVPAAGVGRRMGADIPKQYLPLAGRMVIEHALEILLRHPCVGGLVVAIGEEDRWWPAIRFVTDKMVLRVAGGAERCHSVLNGLRALEPRISADDWVLVHDAVRPCLRDEDLDHLIMVLRDDPVGGLLAAPVRDTMKRADSERVSATVDRVGLWHALTPQMFRLGILNTALRKALAQGWPVTDESAAVEAAGFAPRLVEGRADNIKITRAEDLALAEFFLNRR